MELSRYIKEILIDKGKVVVPDLGTFEKTTIPAKIDKKTNEMQPPQSSIVFYDKSTMSENVLCEYIAKDLNITTNEARQKVKKQINLWISLLNSNKKVAINGLGFLHKPKGKPIMFNVNIDALNFPEYYGLSKISVSTKDKISGVTTSDAKSKKPKTKQTNKKQAASKKPKPKVAATEGKKRKKRGWIWIVLLLLLLGAGGFAFWKFDLVKEKSKTLIDYVSNINSQPEEEQTVDIKPDTSSIDTQLEDKAKQDSIDEIKKQEDQKTEAILENYTIIDSKTNVAVSPKLTELQSASKIHIIAGSFSSKVNANEERRRLINLGFENAQVLPLSGKLYRVSIEAYDNVKDAVNDFDRVKSADNSLQIWLLLDK